jgi:hypothetical protein
MTRIPSVGICRSDAGLKAGGRAANVSAEHGQRHTYVGRGVPEGGLLGRRAGAGEIAHCEGVSSSFSFYCIVEIRLESVLLAFALERLRGYASALWTRTGIQRMGGVKIAVLQAVILSV